MPSQTHQTVIRTGSSAQVANGSVVKTANTEVEIGSTIATGNNDVLTIVLDVSNVVAWWLLSDRNVTFTVNDDGTPDETYNLVAGVPLSWHSSDGTVNPMATDWTSVKIANASGATAVVTGGFLVGT